MWASESVILSLTQPRTIRSNSDTNWSCGTKDSLAIYEKIINDKNNTYETNTIKIGGEFRVNFQKKPWSIALGNFQILAHFLQWS